jgi:hypothetical protein
MRDKFKGKRLDYRRSWLSCRGFSLDKQFDEFYPESRKRNYISFKTNIISSQYTDSNGNVETYYHYITKWIPDRPSWQWWYYRKREWIAQRIGVNTVCERRGGSMNSWFRKNRNKEQRFKQKQALQKAMRDNKLDEFVLPARKRDIRWDYW